jgi:predicted CXXCH cytochrome family protein
MLIYIRFLKRLPLVLLICCFSIVCAIAVRAAVRGSGHDFSAQGYGSTEICIFCHTPHNAKQDVPDSPLWNHRVTTATYTLYSSPTIKQIPQQPRGPSKLCLSCHDGTVAIDSFGNSNGSHFITGTANMGINLSDDHPISISWDHQTLSGGRPSCSSCHSFHGAPPPNNLPFFNGYLECGTCHEPHNKPPAGGSVKMLRESLDQSTICLRCHGK